MKSKDQKSSDVIDPLDVVNRSGFPLQIAVADEIGRLESEQGWSVLYTEHAWRSPDKEDSGFIDLVVQSKDQKSVLVIECKRDFGGQWVFMNQKLESHPRKHANLLFMNCVPRKGYECDWGHGLMTPENAEVTYCTMTARDPNGRPMLIERIAAELVAATEALAIEEGGLVHHKQISRRIYANVVVTTAKLFVCESNPKTISLVDGTLPNANMREVTSVRFRKQVSTRPSRLPAERLEDFSRMAYAKEHTVLIVNAAALCDVLRLLELAPYPH